MAFSQKRRWNFLERKSSRYSLVGRQQEKTILEILEKAKERGEFIQVEFHRPFSADDLNGKDFTVVKVINGKEVSKSFGVTISSRRRNYSRLKHPYTPQFLFPLATKPETIIKAINKLF